MYINTGVGKGWAGRKVSLYATDKYFQITIYKPVDSGFGCGHVGVTVDAQQATAIAHRLEHPLPDQWDVLRVKHTNRVHPANIGIGAGKIGIQIGSHLSSSGPSDSFRFDTTETLDSKEAERLRGFLYHWAGAMLIGYVSVKEVIVQQVLPLVDKS